MLGVLVMSLLSQHHRVCVGHAFLECPAEMPLEMILDLRMYFRINSYASSGYATAGLVFFPRCTIFVPVSASRAVESEKNNAPVSTYVNVWVNFSVRISRGRSYSPFLV